MCIQSGYFGMVMRSCARTASVVFTVAGIIASLALVFGFELLFGRADIGALVVAVIIGISSLILWSGRGGKVLSWLRGKFFESIWQAARYF